MIDFERLGNVGVWFWGCAKKGCTGGVFVLGPLAPAVNCFVCGRRGWNRGERARAAEHANQIAADFAIKKQREAWLESKN